MGSLPRTNDLACGQGNLVVPSPTTFAAAVPVGSADKWHLDETVVSMRGNKHWLGQAVDQDGFVLNVLIQASDVPDGHAGRTSAGCRPRSIPILIVAVSLLIVRVKHALEAGA